MDEMEDVELVTALPIPVLIRDGATTKNREARLRVLTINDLPTVDLAWKPYLNNTVEAAKANGVRWWRLPQHQEWEWGAKIDPNFMDPSDYLIYGVECDGAMQGLMIVNDMYHALLDDDGEIADSLVEKPIIHIDFLCVAPWNLAELLGTSGKTPRFKSVGRVLMQIAVDLSFENGYRGRVGLYALPQAESFYEKCGMIPMDRECDHECLCYYELIPSAAEVLRGGAK
ncbi:MAG: hypothetical protein ABIY70_28280 [Capsulimonas sp.]|uniref:hypothetical protein n=1 Tax=Capsulimonas sp. TaxID=2494211 RepID=UPI003266F35A